MRWIYLSARGPVLSVDKVALELYVRVVVGGFCCPRPSLKCWEGQAPVSWKLNFNRADSYSWWNVQKVYGESEAILMPRLKSHFIYNDVTVFGAFCCLVAWGLCVDSEFDSAGFHFCIRKCGRSDKGSAPLLNCSVSVEDCGCALWATMSQEVVLRCNH